MSHAEPMSHNELNRLVRDQAEKMSDMVTALRGAGMTDDEIIAQVEKQQKPGSTAAANLRAALDMGLLPR